MAGGRRYSEILLTKQEHACLRWHAAGGCLYGNGSGGYRGGQLDGHLVQPGASGRENRADHLGRPPAVPAGTAGVVAPKPVPHSTTVSPAFAATVPGIADGSPNGAQSDSRDATA